MTEYLPKEVLEGLHKAKTQKLRKKSRLRVRDGDKTFTVLRHWDDGFALDVDDGSHLRGLVDLYDGARHISRCLIVAAEQQINEMVYEFKRTTDANTNAPLDYVRAETAPVALLDSPEK